MKYRAEIDGLRAIAVIPVILFHAGFGLFRGGFVGVDVFFVISGYLITTIIINELEDGKFSLLKFYERRARRILPALFFVVFCCIPLAWLVLPAYQMRDFANSLIGVMTFSSNILFWKNTGYFDTEAEIKPLLHTWSLAVEEQYYIFFPIFLMATWRGSKRRILWFLSVLFVFSLFAAQWTSYYKPSFAFYLLPTRGWELLIGCFAALYQQKGNISASAQLNNTLSILGLLLIMFSIFFYDGNMPHPSLYTMVPAIGTVLIIIFAVDDSVVRSLLSLNGIVAIGLVSYSLYLWHQPLFAFSRVYNMAKNPTISAVFILALTSLLSYISWRFIEAPFRNRQTISRKSLFAYSLASIVFIGVLGVSGHVRNGFPAVAPPPLGLADEIEAAERKEITYLIGDSHANHLLYGLETLLETRVVNKSGMGCIPFINVDRFDSRVTPGECAREMNNALNEISSISSPANVILSMMGPVYLDGTAFNGKGGARIKGLGVTLVDQRDITDRWKVVEVGMRNTFKQLSSNYSLNVIFVIDVPELGIDDGCNRNPKELSVFNITIRDLVSNIPPESCRVSRIVYDKRVNRYKEFVHNIAKDFPGIRIFDPTSLFCDTEWCYGFTNKRRYLYRDFDHLSNNGSLFVARHLLDIMR